MDWRLAAALGLVGVIALTWIVVAVCWARKRRDGQIGEVVGRPYPGQRPKRRPPGYGRKGHSK